MEVSSRCRLLRCCTSVRTFVQSIDAFLPKGLHETIKRTIELTFRGCLQSYFDRVERMPISTISTPATSSRQKRVDTHPTLNFAIPEKTPATKPL